MYQDCNVSSNAAHIVQSGYRIPYWVQLIGISYHIYLI